MQLPLARVSHPPASLASQSGGDPGLSIGAARCTGNHIFFQHLIGISRAAMLRRTEGPNPPTSAGPMVDSAAISGAKAAAKRPSFQELILKLQTYWAAQGCVILQPYDMEMGAGTFHPATTLRALGPQPWKAAYVQPSRRPSDGRYGENPNRLQHYYQFQVILKPSPANSQELYLKSLEVLGIDPKRHDIRFVEDDWESPTLGA